MFVPTAPATQVNFENTSQWTRKELLAGLKDRHSVAIPLSMHTHKAHDPIDILPFELFHDCILLALPLPERGYTATLLLFTAVSKRWRGLLAGSPSLWAAITINGYAYYSLAMISVSLHLSRDVPISLTVCPPIWSDWNQACSLLAPQSHRIRQIILIADPLSREFDNRSTIERLYWLALRQVLDSLRELSSITSLDLGTTESLQLHSSANELQEALGCSRYRFSTPPVIRHMRKWILQLSLIGNGVPSLYGLQELHTEEPIDTLLPTLQEFSHLERLHLAEGSDPSVPKPVDMKPKQVDEPPKLTSLIYSQPFSRALLVLLPMVASTLRELVLTIPNEKVGRLIPVLESTVQLQSLNITIPSIVGAEDGPPLSSMRVATVVTTLRSLSLRGYNTLNTCHIWRDFVSILVPLYPKVTNACIDMANSIDVKPLLILLWGLRQLRNLETTFSGRKLEYQRGVHLPNLEEVSVRGTNVLPLIIAPNVLRVSCDGPSFARLEAFCRRSRAVRSISIHDRFDYNQLAYNPDKVERGSFSDVHTVKVILWESDYRPMVYLACCTSLKKISLSGVKIFRHITSLCLTILYHPEICPAMQELEFDGYPEWDCLFLMLEARNLSQRCGLSRIAKITLSLIPYHLLAPLASLLRGEPTTRPSNEELSIEGTREILFDSKIPGCFVCLQNMLGPCEEPITARNSFHVFPYKTHAYWAEFPQYPLPFITPKDVSDWIHARRDRQRLWLSSVTNAGVIRVKKCRRRAKGGAVIITDSG